MIPYAKHRSIQSLIERVNDSMKSWMLKYNMRFAANANTRQRRGPLAINTRRRLREVAGK
jgi:hypothetical protein